MRRLWHKLTGRQRLLALVAVLLAVLVAGRFAGPVLGRLPLPENIRAQERELLRRQQRLAELKARRQARDAALVRLRQQAAPFWHLQSKTPAVEVTAEFARLARQADVKIQQVGAPRTDRVANTNHVREVEFTVRLMASMREVTRLLAQLEQSPNVFLWSKCDIRPDNRRAPKAVVLNGRIKALVLSPEASRFLAGEAVNHE